MRKFMALSGMAAMLLITPVTPAFAVPEIDPDAGVCTGQVPNADGVLTGPVITGTLQVTRNKTWVTMSCHFDVPEELIPPKATHARDFPCGIPPDVPNADQTRISASSGGRMVMTCRFRNR